jgi:hemoglobin-like flavoprotein
MTSKDRSLLKECVEYIESESINELCDIFYKKLFDLDPKIKLILSDNDIVLRRKFFNMFSTFKSVKYIDKISEIILQMGARHKSYGINEKHIELMKKPLFDSLHEVLGDEKFNYYKAGWEIGYQEIENLFKEGMNKKDFHVVKKLGKHIEDNFIDKIGGIEVIRKIHVKFYDILFEEPWIGQFFAGKVPKSLVLKQTQFMSMAFGGKNEYKGETPAVAHMHMLITNEMLDYREKILRKCILDEGISEELCNKWIEVDHFYGSFLVKKSKEECILKCMGQAPAMANKPKFYEPVI